MRPAADLNALGGSLKRWWEAQELVERNGNTPHEVARFELHQRLLGGLSSRGFEPTGKPGNLRCPEFQERDWRITADVIALVVRRISSGESLG